MSLWCSGELRNWGIEELAYKELQRVFGAWRIGELGN